MGDAAGDGGEAPGTSTPPASPSSSCTSQGQTRRAPSRGSRAGLELWVRQPGGVSVEPQAPSPTLLHPPPLRSPTAASHRPQTAPSARGPLVHASPATSPSSCGWPHPQRSTPHPLQTSSLPWLQAACTCSGVAALDWGGRAGGAQRHRRDRHVFTAPPPPWVQAVAASSL